MDDTTIVNNLTDTLSVSITKCEMALDTIAVQVANKSDAVDTFWGMPIVVAQFIVPALMSLVVALIVFGIGEYWKSRRERKRKLKKYKSTSLAIKTYVDTLDESVVSLTSRIRKFMSDSLNTKSILFDALNINKIMVDCLKHYSMEELTLIYVTNRDGDIAQESKNLYYAQSSIDYLSFVAFDILKYYEDSQKKMIDLLGRWNSYANAINSYHTQWFNQRINGDINKHFSELLKPFCKNGCLPKDWEAKDWYEKVYSPMQKWCIIDFANKHSSDLYPYEENLRNICQVFEQRNALFVGVPQKMGEYASNIEQAYSTLKKSIYALDKNEFVKLSEIE